MNYPSRLDARGTHPAEVSTRRSSIRRPRRIMGGHLVGWLAVVGVLLLPTVATADINFDCPFRTKVVKIIPWAKARALNPVCNTFVTCQNLDRKTATITVQFVSNSQLNQAGSDATVSSIITDRTATFAARDDQIYDNAFGDLISADADSFRGSARVCSDTRKLACNAFFACDNGTGIVSLRVINKRQIGD